MSFRPLARRIVLITLDGVGIGSLPDAAEYGDQGANTLKHVAEDCGGLSLPNLGRLGLGNLLSIPGVPLQSRPAGAVGRAAIRSAGKDTTTGHWELAGMIQAEPFPSFPQGFPPAIIDAFQRDTGLEPLGNIAASGTEIIRELGEEHLRTGRPIVYTSVDSVFQIAAHEDVIPPDHLYDLCRIARRILDPYRVARVIARPFIGRNAGDFRRTSRRHDFSLPPVSPMLLDHLTASGLTVVGVGKISDIFATRGISESLPTSGNGEGMVRTFQAFRKLERGMVFANLVDFDMLFGHRRDSRGFGKALEEFDRWLPTLLRAMAEDDLLIITADHGCDPAAPGTDHTREYVPVIAWTTRLGIGPELGTRSSLADVGATVGEAIGVDGNVGESFWPLLKGTCGKGRQENLD